MARTHSCIRFLTAFSISIIFCSAAFAEETDTVVCKENLVVESDTVRKHNIFRTILEYFDDSNKPKTYKKFDFSLLLGPHYDTDTKLGLGIAAAGLYRNNPADTVMPPSSVSLYGDISTAGFYLLGIKGLHLFPADRYRMDYKLYFFSFPSYYWGVGYENGNNKHNKTSLKRWQAQINAAFLFRLARGLYLGPLATYDFVNVKDIKDIQILDGGPTRTSNLGVGLSLVLDTRDVMTFPTKGVYFKWSELARPRFLGNNSMFHTTDAEFSVYNKVWKGGVLAYELHGKFNFGKVPWSMMATLGDSYSMRGYYEGRYRDKHKIDTQLELRQHIWRRNSAVFWVGAGTVFDRFSQIHMKRILPNIGIGYRWEFKKNVNIRLDYGFGKSGQGGFIFNINEAF